ncbi:ParB/RepB/Spo0J family partition protein [Actinomadura keratinilytica]|uniref:ParB-like N-terminal domain-containing protein n=1 Tax=Actinomadura keratinilytica TaxID=547461 RepID=A0ABP7ZHE8_9ACTN
MSKADQLGDSPSFAAATRTRSMRGKLISTATGEAAPAAAAPPQEGPPRTIPIGDLAHNPFNPRNDVGEIQETADSLLSRGQIQPITVVTRKTFLQAHPGSEDAIGSAAYVVLDGNRRLAAARLAGLDELRADVNDALAGSSEDMLESALIANLHREDLTPLEEARTLARLVEVHGSQRQVARRIGKSNVWVSQRLALLELTPELQEELKSGDLTVEDARKIGKLPKEEQAGAAQDAKAARQARVPRQREKPRPADEGPASGAEGVNAVSTPKPRTEGAPARSASARVASDGEDVAAIARELRSRLTREQCEELAKLLVQEH